jgi:hypothetical protein
MRLLSALTAATFLTALSVGARADITFHDHLPGALQPAENVLIDSSSGFNVFGHTNTTNKNVTFTSDENLMEGAQGQANVSPVDGGYKTLCIEIVPGWGFTEIEFNVNMGRISTGFMGNIQIDVYGVGSDLPATHFSTIDENGADWFSIETSNGTMMTKVCITTDQEMQDTRQWRVGGVALLPGDNVPEGSSIAMLGTGILPLAGFMMKRRRAKK